MVESTGRSQARRRTVRGVEWQRIVDPSFEMDLAQDDEARARSAAAPWLQPWAVSDDLELRLATSCTVVRTDDGVVLVDPFCTFGGTSDAERRVALLASSGVAVDDVTHVVFTHVDGVGLLWFDDGSPVFTSARVLVPGPDLSAIDSGAYPEVEPLLRIAEPHASTGSVVPGVQLVPLDGHQAGHSGVAIGDPWEVLCTGHLFIDPSMVLDLGRPGLDQDVVVAAATRASVLSQAADSGFALLGPLWPEPGIASVSRSGSGFTLVPVGT